MQSLTLRSLRCLSHTSDVTSSQKLEYLFVPRYKSVSEEDVMKLQHFVDCNEQLTVLTGAGVSTESGQPDYRSEDVGLYARSPNRPVQFKNFMGSLQARKRYWIRNFIGWERFSSLEPSANHLILANWEKLGRINSLVTQNVDRLHTKAGSMKVIELHGTTHNVKCMSCSYFISRQALQKDLMLLNSHLLKHLDVAKIRPDGDIEVNVADQESFTPPSCPDCSGILKPDAVFFGESVPGDIVRTVYKKVEESDALLVLGTSLQVYSGYRFVYHAAELKKPIAIVNIGLTRGDHLATLKIDSKCSEVLKSVNLTQSSTAKHIDNLKR